jgi:hypothetical protein
MNKRTGCPVAGNHFVKNLGRGVATSFLVGTRGNGQLHLPSLE